MSKIEFNFIALNVEDMTELALLMSWRLNPDIYRYFLLHNKPLIWEEHLRFISESKNRLDYFFWYQSRPIGHIALSNLDSDYPEISILIGETNLWGKGLSNNVLAEFIKLQFTNGFNKLSARISNHNVSSIRLFQNNGFVYNGALVGEPDWSLFIYDINS